MTEAGKKDVAKSLMQDASQIMRRALEAVKPDGAVRAALKNMPSCQGKLILVAIGKAGWAMAKAAVDALPGQIAEGIVITKYDHSQGELPHVKVYEAGHPVPDDNSFKATLAVLDLVKDLKPEDRVLFLVSGGGSALFEAPLTEEAELQSITNQLLASGADIREMNTIRKRLSQVKGGRFALACEPAKVYAIVLSDIVGDPLDMIASGPAYPDASTCEEALNIVKKYNLHLSPEAMGLLAEETPKELTNVKTVVTGSVKELCASAMKTCKALRYEPIFLTASLEGEAREAGNFLAAIAQDHQEATDSLAYICGGETVVTLKGKGKGGRNQELALSAALGLDGLEATALFSLGSDGTDGPTNAAGGYVDGTTVETLRKAGVDAQAYLDDNNSYVALEACGGLLITGPTGTNVNDLTVLLIKR